MANIANQREVQIGNQAVNWSTIAAPTIQLVGVDPASITVSPSIVTEIVQRAAGSIGPGRDTISPRHEVTGCSFGGMVVYEQIPYILEMLHSDAAPTGAGPYVYEYVAPTTAQVVPRSQTLTMGVGDAVFGIVGACASSITFEWAWGQPVTYSVELMGHSLVADTLEVLTEPLTGVCTYALASQGLFYVDALGGTMGATAVTNVHSGNLTINLNRKYNRKAGSLYPTGVYDHPSWNATGSIVFEEDAASAGYADAILAGATAKLLRVFFTNGGAVAALRSLRFDITALCRVPSLITDDDGMSTIQMDFESIEAADGGYLEIDATNNTANTYA